MYHTMLTAPVFGLRREIDRLFEDTSSRDSGNAWAPPADIREDRDSLTFELELPGISPERVEVTANQGVLTVRGEKRVEPKDSADEGRYHRIERTYGAFSRSFQLPQGVDDERIEASFDQGVLTVRIPKAALPQPRKINIRNSRNVGSVAGEGRNGGDGDPGKRQRIEEGKSDAANSRKGVTTSAR